MAGAAIALLPSSPAALQLQRAGRALDVEARAAGQLDAAGIELASRWLCSSTPNPRPACGARRGQAPENLYRSQGPPAAVE
ncbi:hypothetical protein J3A72_000501 [Stenotrophomonas sp. PvP093]|uniref:hypothetical protein n=1 Tax=unclassified Stenotrophomonas TaxID=196198 RepID=UPI001AE81B88|nr:hypothetical protein [Stenotrophomonas sp. PvP093]MBP2480209.1 hypothetical protein [Stenotrophomonas sp. PvP093]